MSTKTICGGLGRFLWASRFFSEFRVAGKPRQQEEMKISAMSSIGEVWATVAYLVGTPEDVSYDDFQALMLQKEAE